MRHVALSLIIALGTVIPTFAKKVERVEIRIGQQKTTSVGHLKIRFVKVLEDSRCPMNAKCVWAGNAKVQLTVKGSKGTRTIELNTGREPHVATYDGYDIRMEDVAPGPGGDPKTPRPAPVLTISVEKHGG